MKTFVLFLSLVLSFNIYAQTQEEQLKAHDWYVYKVIIEDETHYRPIHEETVGVESNFVYNQEHIYIQLCWSSALDQIIFIDDNQFSVANWIGLPLTKCQEEQNIVFSQQYDDVLLYQAQNLLFDYQINQLENEAKELVVTNEQGNKAYFYSTYLSSDLPLFEKAKIYPNPAQSTININLPNADYQNINIQIFDISGKKIKSFTKSWQENILLNIEDLPSGNYMLELYSTDHQSDKYSLPFIKQ